MFSRTTVGARFTPAACHSLSQYTFFIDLRKFPLLLPFTLASAFFSAVLSCAWQGLVHTQSQWFGFLTTNTVIEALSLLDCFDLNSGHIRLNYLLLDTLNLVNFTIAAVA